MARKNIEEIRKYHREWSARKRGYSGRMSKARKVGIPEGPERASQYQAYQRKRRLHWLGLYKKAKGCSRCGYNECAQALDFDHIDPNQKRFNASSRQITMSLKTFFKEVRKCRILCANCHRMLTYQNEQFLKPRRTIDISGKGGTCGA